MEIALVIIALFIPLYIQLVVWATCLGIKKDIQQLANNDVDFLNKFSTCNDIFNTTASILEKHRLNIEANAYKIEMNYYEWLDYYFRFCHLKSKEDSTTEFEIIRPVRTPEQEIHFIKRLTELNQEGIQKGYLPFDGNSGDSDPGEPVSQ